MDIIHFNCMEKSSLDIMHNCLLWWRMLYSLKKHEEEWILFFNELSLNICRLAEEQNIYFGFAGFLLFSVTRKIKLLSAVI